MIWQKRLGKQAINLHFMTGGAPDYTLEPLFLEFLDEAVSWAEELDLNLILDNHTFDVTQSTDPGIGNILEKVWIQMAAHYRDSYDKLYYEVLNEPHGIDDEVWNDIQGGVIGAIRTVDTVHTIIVGGANYNSYNNLAAIPAYSEPNLIYTFHFYDPFLFTHQGASWVDPSMVPLAGIPFPYDPDSMPPLPSSLEGTWVGSNYHNYSNMGNEQYVRDQLDIAVAFMNERHVPLYCGELGVFIPNSDPDDRSHWYKVVIDYLEEKGIAWTSWDYQGGFGVSDPYLYVLPQVEQHIAWIGKLFSAYNLPAQSKTPPPENTLKTSGTLLQALKHGKKLEVESPSNHCPTARSRLPS